MNDGLMRLKGILHIVGAGFLLLCFSCRRAETHDAKAEVPPAADVGAEKPVAGPTPQEPGAVVPNSPRVIADLDGIKVAEGMPMPKLGDFIYTMSTLPRDACGEYWVEDSQGHVAKVAVCTHPEGHH